jgi:hypothetical protein
VSTLDERVGIHRSSRLLFGGRLGIQVWQIASPRTFFASVLTGSGDPVIMIGDHLVGTEQEMEALNWALAVIAVDPAGYSALIAAD